MRSFSLSTKILALGTLGLASVAGIAQASDITLSDQNASFVVNTTGNGVLSMTVDGTNHLWEQDFLHDVTMSTAIQKVKGVDTVVFDQPVSRFEMGMADSGDGSPWLGAPSGTSLTGTNQLTLDYTTSPDVSISISFELVGGALGSNAATIIESYTITNTNEHQGDIAVNLFAFTDVDLGGSFFSSKDDEGELIGAAPYDQYRQFDSNYQLLASTNIAPDYYWVAQGEGPAGETTCPDYYQLKCVLYDDVNTTLPNTVLAGPADLQMAAQWVRTLAYGESFTYTHSMQVCGIEGCPEVPVPAAAWLLGSGLLGLVGVARRRRMA